MFTVNHFFSHIFINIKNFSFYNYGFPGGPLLERRTQKGIN